MPEYGLFELEPKPPPRPKKQRDPFTRVAADRRFSQPRHPAHEGRPITKLERLIISSGKFYYEIAAEAGINPSLLSNIVHGRKGASVEVLIKLSRYFHCDPKELLGNE